MRLNRFAPIALAGAVAAFGPFAKRDASVSERPSPPARTLDTATFAGGCFWSVEKLFDETLGVVSAVSGFMGGSVANPSYEDVVRGGTGHAEAVQVVFDPARVTYAQLVDAFWHNIDPTAVNRQFCDGGEQYRTVIFHHDAAQRRLAESSKAALARSGRFDRVVTAVAPATSFYAAEGYHQDYARKNPVRYGLYRRGCGRDRRLAELWGSRKTD